MFLEEAASSMTVTRAVTYFSSRHRRLPLFPDGTEMCPNVQPTGCNFSSCWRRLQVEPGNITLRFRHGHSAAHRGHTCGYQSRQPAPQFHEVRLIELDWAWRGRLTRAQGRDRRVLRCRGSTVSPKETAARPRPLRPGCYCPTDKKYAISLSAGNFAASGAPNNRKLATYGRMGRTAAIGRQNADLE